MSGMIIINFFSFDNGQIHDYMPNWLAYASSGHGQCKKLINTL